MAAQQKIDYAVIDPKILALNQAKVGLEEQAKLLGISRERLTSARRRLGLSGRRGSRLPPEETSFACDLLRQRYSFLQVAEAMTEKFGHYYTRNMVAGISHRFNVKNCRSTKEIYDGIFKDRKKLPIPKTKKSPTAGKFLFNSDPRLKTAPEDMSAFNDLFIGKGKPLHDLNRGDCRWPLEDVDGKYTFCGCSIHRKSYCAEHFHRAYPNE